MAVRKKNPDNPFVAEICVPLTFYTCTPKPVLFYAVNIVVRAKVVSIGAVSLYVEFCRHDALSGMDHRNIFSGIELRRKLFDSETLR